MRGRKSNRHSLLRSVAVISSSWWKVLKKTKKLAYKYAYLQLLGLVPLCSHDVVAIQVGLLHQKTLEIAAPLEQDLEAGASHARAEIDA